MTDLERDDRALIEALKAELIEARNQAETRSIHNARLRSERDVAMEEVERLTGVTEALEKTVKDLIAQHREAKDEVERERAMLKSECTGCEKTERLEDAVARLDAVLKSEVLAYEKQVVGMLDQVSVLNAEVARLQKEREEAKRRFKRAWDAMTRSDIGNGDKRWFSEHPTLIEAMDSLSTALMGEKKG